MRVPRKGVPTGEGVSPIVAEIILISVAVVLASVIFVIVSGMMTANMNTTRPVGLAVKSSNATTYSIVVASLDGRDAGLDFSIVLLDTQGNQTARWSGVNFTGAQAPADTVTPPVISAAVIDGGDGIFSRGDTIYITVQAGTSLSGWTLKVTSDTASGTLTFP